MFEVEKEVICEWRREERRREGARVKATLLRPVYNVYAANPPIAVDAVYFISFSALHHVALNQLRFAVVCLYHQ